MSILSQILGLLTAALFGYIMYLETLATTSPAIARVFKLSQEQLSEPRFNVLMRNQGIYNGCIALMLLPTPPCSLPKQKKLPPCCYSTASSWLPTARSPQIKASCSSKAGCLFWL